MTKRNPPEIAKTIEREAVGRFPFGSAYPELRQREQAAQFRARWPSGVAPSS
jgi:hypothetical protein